MPFPRFEQVGAGDDEPGDGATVLRRDLDAHIAGLQREVVVLVHLDLRRGMLIVIKGRISSLMPTGVTTHTRCAGASTTDFLSMIMFPMMRETPVSHRVSRYHR